MITKNTNSQKHNQVFVASRLKTPRGSPMHHEYFSTDAAKVSSVEGAVDSADWDCIT